MNEEIKIVDDGLKVFGLAQDLLTEQPIFGFKFVPFEETDDRHFRLAGYESKNGFLEEFGYKTGDLDNLAFPISGHEPGNFPELISTEDAEQVFRFSRSVFDRDIMFIAGTPNRIFPCPTVQSYFEELGVHDEEELREALEEAGLEYQPASESDDITMDYIAGGPAIIQLTNN